jgi:hypothetical protein
MEDDPEPSSQEHKSPVCGVISLLAAAFAFALTRGNYSTSPDWGSGIAAALMCLAALVCGGVTGLVGLARGERPRVVPLAGLIFNFAVFVYLKH